MEKDLEGGGRALFEGTTPAFDSID